MQINAIPAAAAAVQSKAENKLQRSRKRPVN